MSNGEALLAVSSAPDHKCYIWSWRTGARLATIDLAKSSVREEGGVLAPLSVSFSPVNWRRVMMAYAAPVSDLHLYSLAYFDAETQGKCRVEARVRLPLTDRALAQPEPVCMGVHLNKDELAWLPSSNAHRHITGLPNANLAAVVVGAAAAAAAAANGETSSYVELDDLDDEFKGGDRYSRLIEALAVDRRQRHEFRCACWSSTGEQLLIATRANYVFRVSVSPCLLFAAALIYSNSSSSSSSSSSCASAIVHT